MNLEQIDELRVSELRELVLKLAQERDELEAQLENHPVTHNMEVLKGEMERKARELWNLYSGKQPHS